MRLPAAVALLATLGTARSVAAQNPFPVFPPINAAIAAQFGVPVVMITGDDQIVAETKQRLGGVEGVAVKRAIGFHSTSTLTPEVAQAQIRQRGRVPAELLGYLPNVQRIDSHTVRFMGKDMIEVSKFLEFLTSCDPTLTP